MIFDKIRRWWNYLKRGHSQIGFIIGILNFVAIWYTDVVLKAEWLRGFFPTLFKFMIIVGSLYIIIMTFGGLMDYKRGTFFAEALIALSNNPLALSDFFARYEFYEFIGAEKSVEELKPWVEQLKKRLDKTK